MKVSVRPSEDFVLVPATAVDPAVRPSVAELASGALNVTVTGALTAAPGSPGAGAWDTTASGVASCVKTTSTM